MAGAGGRSKVSKIKRSQSMWDSTSHSNSLNAVGSHWKTEAQDGEDVTQLTFGGHEGSKKTGETVIPSRCLGGSVH